MVLVCALLADLFITSHLKKIKMITPPGSPSNNQDPSLKENIEKLKLAQFKISPPSLMGIIPVDITYRDTFLDQSLTGIVKYSPYLTDIGNFKPGHAFKNNAMLVDNPLRVNQILTISIQKDQPYLDALSAISTTVQLLSWNKIK